MDPNAAAAAQKAVAKAMQQTNQGLLAKIAERGVSRGLASA